jgi:hypothetical protein
MVAAGSPAMRPEAGQFRPGCPTFQPGQSPEVAFLAFEALFTTGAGPAVRAGMSAS